MKRTIHESSYQNKTCSDTGAYFIFNSLRLSCYRRKTPRPGAQSDATHHLCSERKSYLQFIFWELSRCQWHEYWACVKVNGVDHTIPLDAGQDVPSLFCHSPECARTTYDAGAMDAFNLGEPKKLSGSSPYACYQYGGQSLIPNYWQWAPELCPQWQDASLRAPWARHFPIACSATVAGGSGTYHPAERHLKSNKRFSGKGPMGVATRTWQKVLLENGSQGSTCFSFATLADKMQQAGVVWSCFMHRRRGRADMYGIS